jgi:hypothetical protein
MKLTLRISALAFLIVAAFAGNPHVNSSQLATTVPSSVPGGGGPMPICNPFTQVCPPIR